MLLLLFALTSCRSPAEDYVCDSAASPSTPTLDDDAPLTAGDVLVTPLCDNVLAARVKVNTSKAASAAVQLGPADEGLQWQTTSEAALSHDVLIIGMRPEQDYDIQVVLTAGDQTVTTETVTLTTGTPPDHIVRADVSGIDPAAAWDGWTLMDVNNNNGAGTPYTAVMFDMEGYPVWYYVMEDTAVVGGMDVQLTHRDTVLLGGSLSPGMTPIEVNLDGSLRWVGPAQLDTQADGYMHHHFELLENGNYLTLEKVFVDGIRGDIIRELAPDFSSAWSWNTFDWLEPSGEADWTHANWAHISGGTDSFVYVSHRHESAIYKIDYSTGEVIWRLGAGGDFALDGEVWFDWQHAPSVLDNGNILLYDNLGDNRIARVVEYELDVESWTAHEVWSYGGDNTEGWLSEYWGDADRLPNGNTLITAGANQLNTIMEVSPDGEILWQLENPDVQGTSNTMYRAERVTPPLIEPL